MLAIGVVLAFVLGALWALLATDAGRAFVLRTGLTAVNDTFRGKLTVERLDGTPWTSLVLRGAALHGPDGAPILALSALEVDVDLLALLRQHVEVRRVSIQGLRGVVVDESGALPLLSALPEPSDEEPEASGPPWTVAVRSLEVSASDLAVAPGLPALSGLELLASAAVGEGAVAFDLRRLAVEAPLAPVDRALLACRGAFADGVLSVSELEINAFPHRLSAAARYDFNQARGEVAAQASVELAQWLSGLGLDAATRLSLHARYDAGDAEATAVVDSPVGQLRVASRLGAELGTWAIELGASDLAVHALAPGLGRRLSVDAALSAQGTGNPLTTGSATASLVVPTIRADFVTPTKLELSGAARGQEASLGGRFDGPERAFAEFTAAAGHITQGPWSLTLAAGGLDEALWRPWLGDVDIQGSIGAIEVVASAKPTSQGISAQGNLSTTLRRPATSMAGGYRAERIRLDAAAEASPLSRLERASVTLSAEMLEASGARLDSLEMALEAKGTLDELAVKGPITARGVAAPGGLRLGSGTVDVDLSLHQRSAVDGTVRLDLRDGKAKGARFRAAKARLFVDAAQGLLPSIRAKGNIDVSALGLPPHARAERLELELDARLGGATLRGRAKLVGTQVAAQGKRFPRLALDAELHSGRELEVDLRADGGTTVLALSGRAEIPTRRKPTGRALLGEIVATEAGVGARIRPGASATWDNRGSFDVRGVVLEGIGLPGRLEASARHVARGGAVDGALNIFDVDLGPWHREAAGWAGLAVSEAELLQGKLQGTASVGGTIRQPVGAIDLTVQRVTAGPVAGVVGRIAGKLAPGSFEVDSRLGWPGGGKVAAQGSLPVTVALQPFAVEWPVDAPFALKAEVEGVDLSWLGSLLPGERGWIAGKASMAFTGQGSRAAPVVQASAAVEDLRVRGWRPQRVSLDAALDLERTRATLELIDAAESSLTLSAEVPSTPVTGFLATGAVPDVFEALRAGSSSVELTARALSLERMLRVQSSAFDIPAVVGTLDGSLRVEGTLDALAMSGGMALRRAWVGGVPLDVSLSSRPELEGAPGSHLSAAVGTGQSLLCELDAFVPADLVSTLREGGPTAVVHHPLLRLDASAANLTYQALSEVSPAAAGALRNLVPRGDGNAHVAFRADAQGPRLDALFAWHRPRADSGSGGGAFRGIDTHVSVRSDRSTVYAVVDQDREGGFVGVEGEVAIGLLTLLAESRPEDLGGKAIRARISTTEFSVTELGRSMPKMFGDSDGTVAVDLAVSGTIDAPTAEGSAVFAFAPLHLPILGWKSPEAKLEAVLDANGARIAPMRILVDGKPLDFELAVKGRRLDPPNLALEGSLRFDSVPLLQRKDFKLRLSGGVDIGGTAARPSVSGKVRIDEGDYAPEFGGRTAFRIGLPPDVVIVDSATSRLAALAAANSAAEKQMAVDLNVDIEVPERALRVRNPLVDLYLGGGLALTTPERQLALEGVIEVDEGAVTLYGRRFEVQGGSQVVFDGRAPVNPRIDLRARYDISGIDLSPIGLTATPSSHVEVQVGGTGDKPSLELSSDPVMDDTNIVAVIITGGPVDAAAASGTGALERQTMNLFAGLATGTLTQLVEGELPIDVFQVQTGSESFTTAKVRVGKRLSRDLLVTYVANMGARDDENANEVVVEYRLIRSLRLLTRVGDAGEGSASLVWTWSN
jgi:hypothetical protein